MIAPPQPEEFNPFYAGYINLAAAHNDILQLLADLKDSTYALFTGLPLEKGGYAYEPGKWTIKQLLGHLIDAERVFAYRLLCISRGDEVSLPGFDENDYVATATFNTRALADLAAEFRTTRESNLYLLRTLTKEQTELMGTANGNPVSVRAIVYIMAGHELHHLNILKTRYL